MDEAGHCSSTSSLSMASWSKENARACDRVSAANLLTENELIPPNGVYATTVTIDGIVHPSISNIGVRPTFGDSHGNDDRGARAGLQRRSVAVGRSG